MRALQACCGCGRLWVLSFNCDNCDLTRSD